MLGFDMKLESRPCFEVVKASLVVTLVYWRITMELYVVLGQSIGSVEGLSTRFTSERFIVHREKMMS